LRTDLPQGLESGESDQRNQEADAGAATVIGHRLVARSMRGWLYGMLFVVSCAAGVSASTSEPRADIDPVHQARVDKVLDLYAFGKRHDWLLAATVRSGDDDPLELFGEVADVFRWEGMRHLLRPAIARALSPEQIDDAIEYYATSDGASYVDCARASMDSAELKACAKSLGEEGWTQYEPLNRSKYTTDDFLYETMTRVDVGPLVIVAICDEFSRNPTLLARLIENCDRNGRCPRDGGALALGKILAPGDGGPIVDHPACVSLLKDIQ
jgi:hypothetical protein